MFNAVANFKKAVRSEKGFTLIELLVTVTIIGILAAVVSIGVGGGTSNAALKARQGTFNQVQAAVDAYLASSTANTLATIQTGVHADTTANDFYGPDGNYTVTSDGIADRDITLTTLVSNSFLRLEANTGLACIFSTTTSQVKGCK